MGPDAADSVRLRDILDLARTVLDRLSSDSASDWTLGRPELTRAMWVIDDAARKVSVAFRAAHAEIPWDSIGETLLQFDRAEPVDVGVLMAHLRAVIDAVQPVVLPQPPDDA